MKKRKMWYNLDGKRKGKMRRNVQNVIVVIL